MQTTKSGIRYTCQKTDYHNICLTILYGNGQEYKFSHTRAINEFRLFAYASIINSAHKQYIIGSNDADDIMNHLVQTDL